jgi:predicted ATPase
LPWVDSTAFAQRAIAISLHDRMTAARMHGFVFFDRGLIDAAAALEHATGTQVLMNYASERYNKRVFVTPPWQEIYVNDADRRHSFKEAAAEYERLITAFVSLDYDVDVLPKIDVADRADIVLERLVSA